MSPSVSPALPQQRIHHLLGHPPDLRGHIDTHGPLNVARGRSRSWRHGLVTSLEDSGLTGRGGGRFPLPSSWRLPNPAALAAPSSSMRWRASRPQQG